MRRRILSIDEDGREFVIVATYTMVGHASSDGRRKEIPGSVEFITEHGEDLNHEGGEMFTAVVSEKVFRATNQDDISWLDKL